MYISIEQGDGGLYRPFICVNHIQDDGSSDPEYLMMPCGRGCETVQEAVALADRVVSGINDAYEGIWTANGRWYS